MEGQAEGKRPLVEKNAEARMDVDEFREIVKQGDILLFEGRSWISSKIQQATDSPWSHVALSVGHEFLVEATLRRSRVAQVTDRLNRERIRILRPTTQTDVQRVRRSLWACTRSGWPYDAPSLSWWLLPDWIRGRKNWLSTRYPICSELVAWAFQKNGEDLFPDRNISTVAPGDFEGVAGLEMVVEIPGSG